MATVGSEPDTIRNAPVTLEAACVPGRLFKIRRVQMLSTKTLAAVAAAMIAIGTMGISVTDASAATMKPYHMLVCKPGYAPHLVKIKVHGKWHRVWRCYRVHHLHPVHPVHPMAPMAKPKTY